MGEIVTFYSYKGGVGRTMALANVAVLLSQYGYKVLAVDWDLEAPGLEFFFEGYYPPDLDLETVIQTEGIIDLLYSVINGKLEPSAPPELDDIIIEVTVPNNREPLHFLTAGRRDQDYFTKVRDLDLETFYSEKKGGYFIEALRNDWKQKYDYVLVDSRTGITDIGGVCTIQLPDILVLLLATNEQSLKGTIDIFQKTALARQKLPFDRLSLITVPIVSRFDSTEEFRIGQKWLSRLSNEFKEIYADWLPASIDRRTFLEVTKIPYMPYFSFGEKLPVLEQGTTDPAGPGYAYESLAALIANKFESVERVLESRTDLILSAVKTRVETAAKPITQPGVTVSGSKRNPFIVYGPVSPEHFIGREKEVKAILDRLANPAAGSTAISGERLIGKTSLLHYICDPQVAESWGPLSEKCIFVFIDSQTIVPFTPDGFWRYVLTSLLAQKAYDPKYIGSLLKDGGKKVSSFELSELFDRIAQEGKLVVLLLDEFEHVVEHVRPDKPEPLYLLRALINRPKRGLALVLSSRESLNTLLRDFRFSGSPFPTSFMSLSLGPFSQAEADELIETYTRGTEVRFNRQEKERIYKVSKGHPHQLQRECHELFEQKTIPPWFSISIQKPSIRGLSKAFINIGLIASTILLVFSLALWYQYIYPETITGTQITPDSIGYSVGYPEWIGVGDTEQFRVALTNEGTQSLSNVRVYLDFSDAATVIPPPGRSLTAVIGDLSVKQTWADAIEFCPEKVSGTDIVQTDLLIASDELGEKLLNTYTFKVIDVPYLEDFRAPKNLIRRFLGGVGTLAGAFLIALFVGWVRIVSSREESR